MVFLNFQRFKTVLKTLSHNLYTKKNQFLLNLVLIIDTVYKTIY